MARVRRPFHAPGFETGKFSMADDDFDIQRLAAYLHVDPAQVARLADRGRLPGRKVAGPMAVFAGRDPSLAGRADGPVGADELKQMETALRSSAG